MNKLFKFLWRGRSATSSKYFSFFSMGDRLRLPPFAHAREISEIRWYRSPRQKLYYSPQKNECPRYNKDNLDSILLQSFLKLMDFFPKNDAYTVPKICSCKKIMTKYSWKKSGFFFQKWRSQTFPKFDFWIFVWIFFPKMTLAQFPVFGFFSKIHG